MGVSKVVYGGDTLIDLTGVTVTPSVLAAGSTAVNAAGDLIEGTASLAGAGSVALPDPIVAGDYPVYGLTTSQKIDSTDYTDLGVYVFTVNRPGTYRFKWCTMKPALSLGGSVSCASALFLNGVKQYENASFSDNVQYNSVDVACSAGDVVQVMGRHTGGSYSTYIYGVSVHIGWEAPDAFFS